MRTSLLAILRPPIRQSGAKVLILNLLTADNRISSRPAGLSATSRCGCQLRQDSSNPVTALLVRWLEGDRRAFNALITLVYSELHRVAHYLLDVALSELSEMDEQQGSIVELCSLAGLTIEGRSEVVGISTAIVKRDRVTTRAWLHHAITGESSG